MSNMSLQFPPENRSVSTIVGSIAGSGDSFVSVSLQSEHDTVVETVSSRSMSFVQQTSAEPAVRRSVDSSTLNDDDDDGCLRMTGLIIPPKCGLFLNGWCDSPGVSVALIGQRLER